MRSIEMTAFAAMAAAMALAFAACASSAPATTVAASEAGGAAAECKIDAVKICQTAGGGGAPAKNAPQMAMPQTGGYGTSSAALPETIEFTIPAGPTLQLMCYYDPQHTKVTRADVANQVAMTPSTVKYLKDQGFCAQ